MKLAPDCYQCLQRLIRQAADLATGDTAVKEEAIEQATKILDDEFSYSQLSIVIATKIHKVVKEVTGNPDPYRAMKEREMMIATELYPELLLQAEAANRRQGSNRSDRYQEELRAYLELTAAANAIDFFREPDSIKEDIRNPVSFALDDSEQLATRLMIAGKVLYLADNAGELYFDLPLVKWMQRFARVTYVVKPAPVQDDLTLEDIRGTGLDREFGEVISTGVASPGVVFSLASARFKREFESAGLIFAKGMGHYEALSEFPPEGRFFYCLKAKCKPVADSLEVPINSYVAMIQ
ncbi:MAG: ARMT1-like domain-containing protein [Dehalococcoidia bacterium]